MADQATAKYLNDNVGSVLAKALADMSINQPADGVDFLAGWLRTYAEQEEAKAWREREEKVLLEERQKTKKKLEEKAGRRKQKKEQEDKIVGAYDKLLAKFNDPDTEFQASMWDELLDVAQKITSAKEVYLGTLDEEGLDGGETGPCICYTHVTPTPDKPEVVDMRKKILKKDEGVTWGALSESPPEEEFANLFLWRPPAEPAPPPVEGEDPPAEPENKPPAMTYFPVNVPCVTDVSKIHYFDMTRLGAYLAVPLVYPSYYSSEAYEDARKYEEEQKAAEAQRAKAAEERAKAAAEGAAEQGEEPEAPAEAEPEVPKEEMKLRSKDVKMVLCMDTLSTNSYIEESKIPELLELAKACGACKTRTEMKQVDAQAVSAIDDELASEIEKEIAKVREEVQEALRPEQENEERAEAERAEGDDGRERLQKKYAFLTARNLVAGMRAQFPHRFEQLKSWVVVPPEVLQVVAAIAFFIVRCKNSEVYPERKTTLKWDKIRDMLDDKFFSALGKEEVDGPRKDLPQEQKLSNVMKLAFPPDFDEVKAKEISPMFELLFILIREACNFRQADIDYRKAQWQKRKEQAEAADPPQTFDEKPLSTQDDDIED